MGNLKAGTQGEWKEEEDDGEGEGGEDEAEDSVAFVVVRLLVAARQPPLPQLILPEIQFGGNICDLLKTNGDWLKQMEVIMGLGDTLT